MPDPHRRQAFSLFAGVSAQDATGGRLSCAFEDIARRSPFYLWVTFSMHSEVDDLVHSALLQWAVRSYVAERGEL